MTATTKAELRARAEKATPHWVNDNDQYVVYQPLTIRRGVKDIQVDPRSAYIAEAHPSRIIELLDEAAALRAKLDLAIEALEWIDKDYVGNGHLAPKALAQLKQQP